MLNANLKQRSRQLLFNLPLLLWLPLCDAQTSVQAGYSTEPLRDPIFDSARVTAQSVSLNNWLVENYKGLSYEQMKGPREHLYYLIDSRIKENFAQSGKVMPAVRDPILEGLFAWAEPLGVYGGALIYNQLRANAAPQKPSLLKVPEGMSINLKGDLLSVKSSSGPWSVDFPYYFMLSRVADFTASNGLRTQVLSLSTGAAKDRSELGHSQASLMLIFSPGANPKTFASSWRQILKIEESAETKDLVVKGLRSQYRYDPKTKIHTEFVSWAEPQGPFAVVYLGVDGTYQWNRAHFLDFLNALRTR